MIKADVLNMQGEKVRTIELPAEIFEAPIYTDLMHQALVRQMANARLGTHQTKGRSDVAGGGKKPWRQKGTGRARQGSSRAPHWKGGGGVHTPHPHSYYLAMPKQMRRAALRAALSAKASEDAIIILDNMALPEAKTRLMAQALNKLVGEKSALILVPEKNQEYETVIRSTNNIPDAKTLMAGYLNIRDILTFDKLILPVQSLDVIAANLG
jgi:large subunit ribosomal protein L4